MIDYIEINNVLQNMMQLMSKYNNVFIIGNSVGIWFKDLKYNI